MNKLDIDLCEVKKLVDLVESHHLQELTVEDNDLSITIKGRASVAQAPAVETHTVAAVELNPAAHDEFAPEHVSDEDEPVDENVFDIVASLVGVFYRSPSPDVGPFVEVGDQVEIGMEVGMIEAMKVFSPIPSEVAGVIVAIPGQNGKLVHAGDVLVQIRVSGE